MCFSAEASFTAAALLTLVGTASLKNVTSRSQFLLASIPLLFGIQQFAEGFIWLHHTYGIGSSELLTFAQNTFLVFAFFIWPIWIPLALLRLEHIEWRRVVLYTIFITGILLSCMNLFFALKNAPTLEVVNHSLQYRGKVPLQTFIYPLIVLLPCFVSSIKNASLFGFLTFLAYLVADYFFTQTFISVWCFFAAIVSICIYKIIKDNPVSLKN